ncbi:hypothetical protein [Desulfogranum mediterraneum]|uniref:hypothetical protein n=1 Tax=Desulfogranum mediterraneum TaxID=160661 RepID=UPI0003F9262B|nr:hypothetical protein [Desulfogranum mediterraneum]
MGEKRDALSRKERRRYPRFKVREGTFAFLESIPCTIEDISEAGMAVQFVVLDKKHLFPLFIDLLSYEQETYLQQIPVGKVDESVLFPPLFSVLQTKKVRVAFDTLNHEQQSGLRRFIARSSIGRV